MEMAAEKETVETVGSVVMEAAARGVEVPLVGAWETEERGAVPATSPRAPEQSKTEA